MFTRGHKYKRVSVHATAYADGDVVRHHIPGRTPLSGSNMRSQIYENVSTPAKPVTPTSIPNLVRYAKTTDDLLDVDWWDISNTHWFVVTDSGFWDILFNNQPVFDETETGYGIKFFGVVFEVVARLIACVAVFVFTFVQAATYILVLILLTVARGFSELIDCCMPTGEWRPHDVHKTRGMLLLLHFAAMLVHFVFAGVVGGEDFEADQQLFYTKPELVADCNAVNISWNRGVSLGLTLAPSETTYNLKAEVVTFFLCSGIAHLIYSLMLALPVVLRPFFQDTYVEMLAGCNQPLRWIEYAVSSAIMIRALAFVSGMYETTLMEASFYFLVTTNMFGFASEALNPPKTGDAEDGWMRPKGRMRSRLLINLLGYIPFSYAYFGILLAAFNRAQEGCDATGASTTALPCPASWISAIIAGTCAVFSSFGLASIAVLACDTKVRTRYVAVEASYVVLSLTAKVALGWTIYINVLQRNGSLANSVFNIEDASNATDTSFLLKVWDMQCDAEASSGSGPA